MGVSDLTFLLVYHYTILCTPVYLFVPMCLYCIHVVLLITLTDTIWAISCPQRPIINRWKKSPWFCDTDMASSISLARGRGAYFLLSFFPRSSIMGTEWRKCVDFNKMANYPLVFALYIAKFPSFFLSFLILFLRTCFHHWVNFAFFFPCILLHPS